MAASKFIATMFLMCMAVAATMNMVAVEGGDPRGSDSQVYNKCFEDCLKSCKEGKTRCEMSCDETCDAEELKAKLSHVGKSLAH